MQTATNLFITEGLKLKSAKTGNYYIVTSSGKIRGMWDMYNERGAKIAVQSFDVERLTAQIADNSLIVVPMNEPIIIADNRSLTYIYSNGVQLNVYQSLDGTNRYQAVIRNIDTTNIPLSRRYYTLMGDKAIMVRRYSSLMSGLNALLTFCTFHNIAL